MRKKLSAALLCLVVSVTGLGVASAHTGAYSDLTLHNDYDKFTSSTYGTGEYLYMTTTWFENRAAWGTRVKNAYTTIDDANTHDIYFTEKSTHATNGDYDWENFRFCSLADSNTASLEALSNEFAAGVDGVIAVDTAIRGTGSLFSTPGGGGTLGVTNWCDFEGGPATDFSLTVLNLDSKPEGDWNATTTQSSSDWDLRGVATHELLHGLGFDGHWTTVGATEPYCDNTGNNDLTMCPGFSLNTAFYARSLEHSDEEEYKEAY